MRTKALCVLGGLWFATGLASAQDPDDQRGRFERERNRPRWRGERGRGDERGGDREERRARRREMMERMDKATPEERRQMRVDRWVSRLSRTYDLDDTQRSAVRAEVDEMSKEYYSKMGPAAEEMDRLRTEMRQYWRTARDRQEAGEDVDWQAMASSEEFAKIRAELEALREAHPFDWDKGVERVERLLPPDQIEEGRRRRKEREERRQDWRERRANGERGGRGGWDRRRGGAETPVVERSAWEAYAIGVIEKYGFDSAQINSARSILKDIQDRADVIERALRNPDALKSPMGELFKELRTRLEELATEQQRKTAAEESL